MNRIFLIGALLLAHAAHAGENTKGVPVLSAPPSCEFAKLGLVRGSSGRVGGEKRANQIGAGGVDMWGERASDAKAIAALQREAAKRDANAVILRRREHSADAGSSARRGDQGLTLVGLAIRTEQPIASAACAAQLLESDAD